MVYREALEVILRDEQHLFRPMDELGEGALGIHCSLTGLLLADL
jgi:hypothetical protein